MSLQDEGISHGKPLKGGLWTGNNQKTVEKLFFNLERDSTVAPI